MLKKAYLEITDVCNLSCSFCHGTKRAPMFMSTEKFEIAVKKIAPYIQYLYFHLMGEPLLHPKLEKLFEIAQKFNLKVIITTNGTLLKKSLPILLNAESLHKISISVHCAEDIADFCEYGKKIDCENYLNDCFDAVRELSNNGKICVFRLWNVGNGEKSEKFNKYVFSKAEKYYPKPWKKIYSGYKIGENVFFEWGERFYWPNENSDFNDENHSCYGLRDHFGILCDGTVVPCCLDGDGIINLGNIFKDDLMEILNSPRAKKLKESFEKKCINEKLCKSCGFATRFK